MIVLHEREVPAHPFAEGTFVETFEEEAAVVSEDPRFDDEDVWQCSRRDVQAAIPSTALGEGCSFSICIRYWPYSFLSSGFASASIFDAST